MDIVGSIIPIAFLTMLSGGLLVAGRSYYNRPNAADDKNPANRSTAAILGCLGSLVGLIAVLASGWFFPLTILLVIVAYRDGTYLLARYRFRSELSSLTNGNPPR